MSDPKPPKLPKDAPKPIKDFLEGKASSVTLAPGKITWLPKPKAVSDAPNPTVTFTAKPGSDVVTASAGYGPASIDLEVSVVDGRLKVDGGMGAKVLGLSGDIDKWVKDVNAWLKHKGLVLQTPVVKDGSLVLTTKSADAPAGGSGTKEQGLKAAAVGILVIGTGAGLALRNAGDETRVERIVETRPGDSPIAPDQPAAAALAIYDARVCLEHGDDSSEIFVPLRLNRDPGGEVRANMATGPTGAVPATAPLSGPMGTFTFPITSYGTYGDLVITGPDGPINLGPLQQRLPFTVGPDEVGCVEPAALDAPPAVEEPTQPQDRPTEEVPIDRTTTTDVPPWSLLMLPGSALVAGGLWSAGRRQTPCDHLRARVKELEAQEKDLRSWVNQSHIAATMSSGETTKLQHQHSVDEKANPLEAVGKLMSDDAVAPMVTQADIDAVEAQHKADAARFEAAQVRLEEVEAELEATRALLKREGCP